MTDIELTNSASDVLIYGFLMVIGMSVAIMVLHIYIIPAIQRVYWALAKALYWALRGNHQSTSFGFGPCKGDEGRGYTRRNG